MSNDEDEKSWRYQSYRPELAKTTYSAFSRGIDRIKARMEDILDKFQKSSGIVTRADAVKWMKTNVTADNIKDIYSRLDSLPDGDIRDKLMQKMSSLSYAYGWTVDNYVKYLTEIESQKIASDMVTSGGKVMRHLTADAYGHAMFGIQKSAGIGFTVSRPPTDLITKAVKSKFNRTASVGYVKQVTEPMRRAFVEGIVARQNPADTMKNVDIIGERSLWVSKAYARTMLTEVSTEVEVDTMIDAGVTQYRYVCTLDERTCPICQQRDGEVYDITNTADLPPAHLNCRCTVATVLDKEGMSTLTRRFAIGNGKKRMYDEVSADTTYAEWSRKYLRR